MYTDSQMTQNGKTDSWLVYDQSVIHIKRYSGLESIVLSFLVFLVRVWAIFYLREIAIRAFIRSCCDMQRMNVSDEFFIVATSRVAFSVLHFDALCFIMATDRESAEIRGTFVAITKISKCLATCVTWPHYLHSQVIPRVFRLCRADSTILFFSRFCFCLA